jgi:hypothetical protein
LVGAIASVTRVAAGLRVDVEPPNGIFQVVMRWKC